MRPWPFVFPLGVALWLARGAAFAAPAAPYRVVQTDGTVLLLSGPPTVKGSLLVGTLQPSGRLVSFPKASVDGARTEEANRAPPPSPQPSPAPRVLADGQTSLGTSHRLVVTREEARRLLESAEAGVPTGTASGPGAEGRRGEDADAEAPEDARDISGRSEAWWKTHASARRRELGLATARRTVAEAELEAAERDDVLPGDAQRRTFVVRVLEAREKAEKARAEETRARERWEALQEDARRSGTPPGWLR